MTTRKKMGEMMNPHWMELQKKLLPDLTEIMKKRISTLRFIQWLGPIGRRSLAASLNTTERVLRSEVEFLKNQDLVSIDSIGMSLTESGRQLLEDLEPLINEWFGLSDLEQQLKKRLHISRVIVVPGDCDESVLTKKALGQAGARLLRQAAEKESVVAVTGGSTIAEVAQMLIPSASMKGMLFVPARGGLGEDVEHQANTLASQLAKKTGGQYRLLHVPDQLSEEAYQSIIHDPNIQELLKVIRSARIVLHGIGDAMTMAERRQTEESTIAHLRQMGAVAEAFGYYFNRSGDIVFKMQTVGLRLEDIESAETVIAVAGGKSKADAIVAVIGHGSNDILITDEGAAKEILGIH